MILIGLYIYKRFLKIIILLSYRFVLYFELAQFMTNFVFFFKINLAYLLINRVLIYKCFNVHKKKII